MSVVVEDDTSLASEVTELDLDETPIQAIYWPGKGKPPNDDGSNYDDSHAAHTVPMSVLRPRRVLTVSGLMIGRQPSFQSQDMVGDVNDTPWPSGSVFDGDAPLPRGYWLCTRCEVRMERSGLIGKLTKFDPRTQGYRFSMSFMTKIKKDWSNWGLFRNLTGKVPQGIAENEKDAIKKLRGEPYEVGQRNAFDKNTNANGVVRAGLYYTNDFTRAFGF